MCKFYDEAEPIITDSELDMSNSICRKTTKMITVKCSHCEKEMTMYLSLYKNRATNGKIFCSRDCYNASGYREEQIEKWQKAGRETKKDKIPVGWKFVPKISFEEARDRLRERMLKCEEEIIEKQMMKRKNIKEEKLNEDKNS